MGQDKDIASRCVDKQGNVVTSISKKGIEQKFPMELHCDQEYDVETSQYRLKLTYTFDGVKRGWSMVSDERVTDTCMVKWLEHRVGCILDEHGGDDDSKGM